MQRFFSKFNIVKSDARQRADRIFAPLRVLLYSTPVWALLVPLVVHAAPTAGAGGKLKALGGKALGAAGDLASSVVGAGVEAGTTLLVWIFIIWQLSDILSDLFSGIFLFLMNFLIGVSQYNSFLGSHIVTIGWSVTRDIANMFLVVALLVIAFATILNINSYQASHLLKDFFFAAILVNFSKMICGVLIDASQVVMMTFVSGYSETAAGNLVKMFKVDEWLQLALATKDAQTAGVAGPSFTTATASAATAVLTTSADAIASVAANFFSTITANVFTTIIAFIGILAVISLDIILVVRIVTLWFLIVASPIAFVAKVLPVTKGFSSKWWHAFNQQLIAGPVVAFIVWISLASIAVSDDAFNLTKEAVQGNQLFEETAASAPAAVAATKISQWENLALYFVPIVIFILGAKWAVGVAGGAAKSISGFANKQLTGVARSGLGYLRKQAVGKGQFSVVTAAKKGFVGERAPVTTGLGKLGGFVNDISGGKIGEFGRKTGVSSAVSKVAGAEARGRNAAGYKNLKNVASQFGFGELGEKRTKAAEAEELGQHFDKVGKEYFENYMKIANDASKSSAEQAEARATALSYKNTYDAKAVEARKKAGDYQKEIFTAEGKTDPQVLLDHMKQQVASGSVSTIELDTAKTMINDFYEKKQKKEIAKKKAEMGAAWDPKFEKSIEGDIAAQQEAVKGDLDALVTNYKAEKVPADLEYGKSAKDAEKAYSDAIKSARPDAQLAVAAVAIQPQITAATIANDYNQVEAAVNNFSQTVVGQLQGMQEKRGGPIVAADPRADDAKKLATSHMTAAVTNVPLASQTNFLQNVAQDTRLDEVTRAAATELRSKIQGVINEPQQQMREILDRQAARGGSASEQLIKPADLLLKKTTDGSKTTHAWTEDAGTKFATALNARDGFEQVLSNLDRESLVAEPVQRIIGQHVVSLHNGGRGAEAMQNIKTIFGEIEGSMTSKQDPGGLKRKGRAELIVKAITDQHPNVGQQARTAYLAAFTQQTPPANPPAATP